MLGLVAAAALALLLVVNLAHLDRLRRSGGAAARSAAIVG